MREILFLLCTFFLCVPRVAAAEVSAECACVMVAETGEVVFEKNAEKEHSMASTTKIMTAILALERCTEEETVTISANAERQEGSSLYLRRGERITVPDLVYGLMLNSGNDAAVALAEHVGGNVEDFARMMTQKAWEIGATKTQFRNPSGLDAEGHYTTAHDLARIAAYAMKNDRFRAVVAEKQRTAYTESGQVLYFKNHNKLLQRYEGAVGIKTGYTKKTGRCLVSAAERNGILLIAVTLNAPNDWEDHQKLLDEGFSAVSNHTVLSAEECVTTRRIGTEEIPILAAESFFVSARRLGAIEIRVSLPPQITAPVAFGEKLGVAEILRDKTVLGEVDLIAGETVLREKLDKRLFLEMIKNVIKSLIL